MQMTDINYAVNMAMWENAKNNVRGETASSTALFEESQLDNVGDKVMVRDSGDFLSSTVNEIRIHAVSEHLPEDLLCRWND